MVIAVLVHNPAGRQGHGDQCGTACRNISGLTNSSNLVTAKRLAVPGNLIGTASAEDQPPVPA